MTTNPAGAQRPTPRRTTPVAAPDHGTDPMDLEARMPTADAAQALPVAAEGLAGLVAARRAPREAVVVTSVRLAPAIRELIDQVADQTGATIREVLEHAVRHTYAP